MEWKKQYYAFKDCALLIKTEHKVFAIEAIQDTLGRELTIAEIVTLCDNGGVVEECYIEIEWEID